MCNSEFLVYLEKTYPHSHRESVSSVEGYSCPFMACAVPETTSYSLSLPCTASFIEVPLFWVPCPSLEGT